MTSKRKAELIEKARGLEAGGDHAGAVAGLVRELLEELPADGDHGAAVSDAIEQATRAGDAER